MNTAIIVAAGKSTRFGGDTPKQFIPLAGKPLLLHSIEKFESSDNIDAIVVVVSEDAIERTKGLIASSVFKKPVTVAAGGDSRARSTLSGLELVTSESGIVLVHDAARPLVSSVDIERVIAEAQRTGAACLAKPITDTVKRVHDNLIAETLDRTALFSAQTPQAFSVDVLRRAFGSAQDLDAATDECSLVESLGEPVSIVAATSANFKITTREDLLAAEHILSETRMSETSRVGHGTDLHRLVEGGPLVIGGVAIDCGLRSDGHSDGDVLLHAVTDALLGAIAAGDIGTHFSDKDEKWKGAKSEAFVRYALELVREKNAKILNLDATVDLERPKIGPYISEMRKTIGGLLELDVERISVKAKTGEGISEIGRSEAIRASAIVLLSIPEDTQTRL